MEDIEMTLDEKVIKTFNLKEKSKKLEKQKEELEKQINDLSTEIEALRGSILIDVNNLKVDSYKVNDIIVTKMTDKTVDYKDADEVIKYLQDNGYSTFVKVTNKLCKKELNKELKTNKELSDKLESMKVEKVTEYVVVTTEEKTNKMFEHIEEKKNKKEELK